MRWTANRKPPTRSLSYVQLMRLDQTTKALIDEPEVWNPQFVDAYPDAFHGSQFSEGDAVRHTVHAIGVLLAFMLCTAIGGTRMSAQQLSLADLEKLKKEVDAQREVIEAQTKLIEAQRAQKQAAELADAKAAKTLSEAEKAAADARKANADAQTAAFKATIGEVPSSGIQGTVDIKDKAGVTEAALLAGRAARLAAQRIADDLPAGQPKPDEPKPNEPKSDQPEPGQVLLLYSAADLPNFNALLTFRGQTALIREALETSERVSIETTLKAPLPTIEFVPPAAALGLGLEAASKILGFFRSDYAIAGVQLSLDDSLLLHALAGNDTIRGKYLVRLPAQYNAQALSQPAKGILQELIALARNKASAASRIETHEKAKAFFLAEGAKATEPQKTTLLANANVHQQAIDTLRAATTLYDGFFTKLTAADDKGNVPLSAVAREDVVAGALAEGAALLVIKLQTSGGAYYTKKNLWTFFGGMPFYNMGGVVASYVLLSGKEGNTLKSGVVSIHGGFIRSNDVQGVVER